ncbi:hypothetical protein CRUP_024841 [Coryphaenoides rupestris]|nr:hypothetical protein CRUP_024841 [Coryphaenoides rupestris]
MLDPGLPSPLPAPLPLSSSLSSSSSPLPAPLPLSSSLSSSSSPLPAPLPLSSSYSSSPPRCPELDLSLPLSHCDQHTQRKVHFKEPAVVKVTKETHLLGNSHSDSRRAKSQRRKGRADEQQAEAQVELSNEKPGFVRPLEEAELNTSLAFRAEIRALQGAEFNSRKAVQETLQKSTRTKNTINAKVIQGVNVSHSHLLYTSLVSLAVEEDQLIGQAARDRLRLPPPSIHHDDKGPSLSQFFTSDLLREEPLLVGVEPTCPLPQPYPGHAHSAFDLYRRHTRWMPTP